MARLADVIRRALGAGGGGGQTVTVADTTTVDLSLASDQITADARGLKFGSTSVATGSTAPTEGQYLSVSGGEIVGADAPEGGGGGSYTDEQARDAVGAMLANSASVTLTHDDAANTITAAAVFGTTAGTVAEGDHTHAIGGVTDLQTTLDGKATAAHTHAIADSTGLQTALDGKAAESALDAANARFTVPVTVAGRHVIVEPCNLLGLDCRGAEFDLPPTANFRDWLTDADVTKRQLWLGVGLCYGEVKYSWRPLDTGYIWIACCTAQADNTYTLTKLAPVLRPNNLGWVHHAVVNGVTFKARVGGSSVLMHQFYVPASPNNNGAFVQAVNAAVANGDYYWGAGASILNVTAGSHYPFYDLMQSFGEDRIPVNITGRGGNVGDGIIITPEHAMLSGIAFRQYSAPRRVWQVSEISQNSPSDAEARACMLAHARLCQQAGIPITFITGHPGWTGTGNQPGGRSIWSNLTNTNTIARWLIRKGFDVCDPIGFVMAGVIAADSHVAFFASSGSDIIHPAVTPNTNTDKYAPTVGNGGQALAAALINHAKPSIRVPQSPPDPVDLVPIVTGEARDAGGRIVVIQPSLLPTKSGAPTLATPTLMYGWGVYSYGNPYVGRSEDQKVMDLANADSIAVTAPCVGASVEVILPSATTSGKLLLNNVEPGTTMALPGGAGYTGAGRWHAPVVAGSGRGAQSYGASETGITVLCDNAAEKVRIAKIWLRQHPMREILPPKMLTTGVWAQESHFSVLCLSTSAVGATVFASENCSEMWFVIAADDASGIEVTATFDGVAQTPLTLATDNFLYYGLKFSEPENPYPHVGKLAVTANPGSKKLSLCRIDCVTTD